MGLNTTEPGNGQQRLAKALDQNEQVRDRVEEVAEELVVINAVLKQTLPPETQTGEVSQALEQHEALEAKVQECVESLAEVNAALGQEISERGPGDRRSLHDND